MNTFSMMILGCKVNDYEATYVKNELLKEFRQVDFKCPANISIIFSCAVTNTAEAKTRKFIHQARRINPNGYIVVVGCLSQIKPDLKDLNEVDLVIGSSSKDKIVELIKNGIKANLVKPLIEPKFENLFIENYPGKDRAFLKIQDGCNQFCSYCVIPYARGNERSLDHNEIIKEAKILSKNFKEIVLTGIHTGRYNDSSFDLYKLLTELVKIDGLETIRLSSIEITEISDEIIDLISSNNKIAKHLHIPVQALSNSVLKGMNRPYTIEEYKNRIEYIRSKIEDVCISTDLITGFPGETDEIFDKSLKELNEIKFSFIHCFPYSRKVGTVADRMNDHIDINIRKNRVKNVLNKQEEITKEVYSHFINKEVNVLIEKNIDNCSYGYSKQYFYVEINGIYPIGTVIKAKIKTVGKNIIGEYVFK